MKIPEEMMMQDKFVLPQIRVDIAAQAVYPPFVEPLKAGRNQKAVTQRERALAAMERAIQG